MPGWNTVGQSGITNREYSPLIIQNPIINGGFEIWQRGASQTVSGVASESKYGPDRFQLATSTMTSGIFTIGQSTSVPAVAKLVPITPYSCKIATTTAEAAFTGNEVVILQYAIEGSDWAPYAQKQFTIGFWARAHGTGVTGTYGLAVETANTVRTMVKEFTISAADTWEYKTITYPESPNVTYNLDNNAGAYLVWGLGGGATRQTAALDTWNSDNKYISPNQINSVTTIGNTFEIWGVTMNLGPTVAPYWPRPYAQELALCQRYCFATQGSIDAYRGHFYASSSPSNQFNFDIEFPVMMRATCTGPASAAAAGVTSIAASAPGANAIGIEMGAPSGGFATGATLSSLTTWQAGVKRCTMRLNGSPGWTSMTGGLSGYAYLGSSTNMIFTAEM